MLISSGREEWKRLSRERNIINKINTLTGTGAGGIEL
jgi:hypothetical protein